MELDDAFAVSAYIAEGEAFPDRWAADAAAFRADALCELDILYGGSPRQRFDLFHPSRLAKGLLVFVHGGYWRRFDKSYWSHLAAGPLAAGWAVAMPSYDLCPAVRITDIGNQIAAAIAVAAERVPGPIRLAGHSAGGHLVARMTAPRLGARWQDRLAKVVPISGIADLAPLMQTAMNADLQLDSTEARRESPVHQSIPKVPVVIWVGADERPVFVTQSRALADAWGCELVIEPGKHHFDVIEGLTTPDSPLTMAVLS